MRFIQILKANVIIKVIWQYASAIYSLCCSLSTLRIQFRDGQPCYCYK
ncbi:hypothetical protein SAMN05192553_11526 [Cyclobacterium xiamenense]|uniref:Uncharacterized protein n=1 Tax=Cyclobacterium xiamenense TaxID=1297121 RepID=A0A1H7C1S6_9BACT|nr:hypothetical protein SAMN05192553_11526 [Cyclobacterium xiamenense]